MNNIDCNENEDIMWGDFGECQTKLMEAILGFCYAPLQNNYGSNLLRILWDVFTINISGSWDNLIKPLFAYVHRRTWDLFETDVSRGWCEPDYINHPYIVEFWNTISNIVLLFLSLYGIYWHYKLHRKVHKQYIVCILIALGSAWYHATLSRIGQLADELPMMILTSMLCHEFVKWNKLPHITTLMSILYIISDTYSIFILYFGAVTGIVLLYPVRQRKRHVQRILYIKAMIMFIIGFIAWNIDVHSCNNITQQLHFHAMWHVFTGFALYWYIQFMMAKKGTLHHDFPLEVIKLHRVHFE